MRKDGRVWIKVVESTLHYAAGRSIFKYWMNLGNAWELRLEDGRLIDYPVRYKPQEGYVKRGWTHRRLAEDALPPPKKVLMRPRKE